jgi:hypothetical protein
MTEHLSTFQRKLAERRAKEMASVQPKEEIPAELADLIPEDDTSYERSDDDIEIDRLIANITVDQAYDRWIRKPRPRERSGKREGVMISCPMPNHADRNPSAWMNLDKNTWYCAGCDEGGDVLDLAAIGFGIPDYKSGSNFAQLREAIAEDYGYTRLVAPGLPRGGILVAPEEKVSVPTPPVATPSNLQPSVEPETVNAGTVSDSDGDGRDGASVTYLPEGLAAEDGEEDEILPGLAWRELVEPGTFLDAYMAACTVDDVPEEYHFWHGMLALGLAVGRDVALNDYQAVLANLFVCTLGRTGLGKSRAASHLKKLLKAGIPELDKTDPLDRGARLIPTSGSAEVLIQSFTKPIPGTSAAGKPIVVDNAPVRGLIDYAELSGLVGRSSRSGSVLKPILMEFFDGTDEVSNASLSSGTNVAKSPFASLLTSTQPKALKDLLDQGDANSGFLNRWVFITGTEKKRVAIGGAYVDVTEAAAKLREVHLHFEPPGPGLPPQQIQWSTEAALMFTAFFEQEVERIKRGNSIDDNREFYQRLDLIMKKLILLFTVNEKLEVAPVSAVEKAIKIFWYLVKVLEILTNSIGSDAQSELNKDILTLVARYEEKNGKGTSCPLHYITKIMGKKKAYTLDMVKRSLQTLTELHMISVDKAQKAGPGRPLAVRYRLATHE